MRARGQIVAMSVAALLGGSSGCSAPESGPHEPTALPAGPRISATRAEYIAARQAEGAALTGYRVERVRSPTEQNPHAHLSAGNPAMRFVTEFAVQGTRIRLQSAGWSVRLSWRGIGCGGGRVEPVQAVLPNQTDLHRVSYVRTAGSATIEEWYVNGPLGLEQGFTLQTSPCPAAAQRLYLEIGLDGLTARRGDAGLDLLDGHGQRRLRYTDAHATDARKRDLATEVRPLADGLLLDVDVTGAVFPIVVDPLIWLPGETLSSSQVPRFGTSVSLSSDTAMVGMPGTTPGSSAGAVAVFRRSATGWTNPTTLPFNGSAGDRFGASVAMAGTAAIVGAPSLSNRGAAFIFERPSTTWVLQSAPLELGAPMANDEFGGAVAMSGTTALVGASGDDVADFDDGSVTVFSRFGVLNWMSEALLQSPDAGIQQRFGTSVALDGDTALIGAPRSDNVGPGAAYVFVRSAGTWTHQQKLTGSDSINRAQFGSAVAIAGNTAIVGSRVPYPGIYVFTRSGTTWTEQRKITVFSSMFEYGVAAAISGDWALISAYNTSSGAGAVHALHSGSGWSPVQQLATPPGLGANALAVFGDTALAGAYLVSDAFEFILKKSDGDSCAVGSECHSDHCVDGRCCDTECDAACDACSVAAGAVSDGVCAIMAAGSPGDPACPSPSACNGVSSDCAPCTTDEHCASDHYCDATDTCQPRKAQGTQCDLAAGADCKVAGCRACSTGFCSDGFCCDADCGGCRACAASLSGGSNGSCTAIPAGRDPKDFCAADAANACGPDGLCDGLGKCRDFATRNTACGATICSDGQVTGFLCSGDGLCESGTEPCAPDLCDGDACGSGCATHAQCAATGYCLDGGCVADKPIGEACEQDEECPSNRCVDGFCCNSVCEGQCEACGEDGTEGTCTPVLGAPRGSRPACRTAGDDNPCSEQLCDGEIPDSCAGFVGTEIVCRESSCANGVAVNSATCNGDGECAEEQLSDCGEYSCAGDVCGSSCASDEECATEFRCETTSATCVARDTTNCADSVTQRNPDGSAEDCTPYVCSGIACLDSCTSSSDCAPSFACNPNSSRCEPPVTESTDDGGCGCRLSSGPEPRRLPALAALLALALLARRRRLDLF